MLKMSVVYRQGGCRPIEAKDPNKRSVIVDECIGGRILHGQQCKRSSSTSANNVGFLVNPRSHGKRRQQGLQRSNGSSSGYRFRASGAGGHAGARPILVQPLRQRLQALGVAHAAPRGPSQSDDLRTLPHDP
ncbi:hypothetical protein TKK_0006445 [Trichogramma kaykai]